ncbi:TIGR02186 family protein [Labrys wisconsinensis]|uniref:Uncharacterized protein (TIGR02186 family) n=1 Tax=Labrys wisconsinensis TaxID=425677 RepID=A0ABU0JFU5_9HYPH|nr:TIGR02186 family protein [Labrys wisconsinensis]MDQ0472351.1 uncharacterized protein (TIGR02186 family) [Labrys wisconsinensis]
MRGASAIIAAVAFVLLRATPAAAENLVVTVSTPRVAIQSNFAGADIVVFGGIERGERIGSHGRYDIAVTVRGPAVPLDVRLKQREAGVWINAERRQFPEAPSFLAIASTRPIDEIATPETVARYRLSLPAALDSDGLDAARPEEQAFRDALIRLKSQGGLYAQQPRGVSFLNDTLFRATIPLPPNVPLGIYQVETRLLIDGEVVTGQRASLEVIKTGFEDQVAQWSKDRAPVYGLATCLIAVTLGWFATVVFRRD